MINQQTCSYCQKAWLKGDLYCVGCGAPEPEAKEVKRQFEFYRDGYFIKAIENSGNLFGMEYFFFRGDKLIERFDLGLRAYMTLREVYNIKDGQDDWEIIWDIFKKAQEKQFGLVRTFEDDPKVKRIEVRIVPWGRELCRVDGENLAVGNSGVCRLHGGKSRSWAKAVGHG
jgi:hypothetical protein